MLEDKLTLIQCVAILHAETIYTQCRGEYHKLITDSIKSINLPDTVTEGDERATLVYLNKYIREIISGEREFSTRTLLSGLKVYSPFDNSGVKALSDMLAERTDMTEEEKVKEAKDTVFSITKELIKIINRTKLKRSLISALSRVDDKATNEEALIAELQVTFEATRPKNKKGKPSSFVAAASTISEGSIGNVMHRSKEVISGKSFKTGWKELNTLMGINDGVRPGECIVIPALPHNAKTTFSMSMFISMAYFNKAEDFVPKGKKGLWLHISLENELEINMPIIYRMIYEHETGEKIDIKNIDAAASETYIREKIQKNGWDIVFERHTGSEFGIGQLRETIESFESDGYHILGVLMDYAGEANMNGLGNGQSGSEVRDFYRRFKDLGSCRDAVMISPHQLSPAAKAFKAMDPFTYVRNLPGRGYYDRCTTVDNVVDMELFIGIQDREHGSFLEVQRGKHRTIVDTPVSHRYIVIPFADCGILPWDYDKEEVHTLKSVNEGAPALQGGDLALGWAA